MTEKLLLKDEWWSSVYVQYSSFLHKSIYCGSNSVDEWLHRLQAMLNLWLSHNCPFEMQ